MVDAVSNVTLQSSAPRQQPQNAAATVSAEPAASGGSSDQFFISSAIRVDNLQNVAILEYRSQSGEVVRQYPTQGQIDAFRRAEHLSQRKEAETPAVSSEPQPAQTTANTAPPPAPAPASAASSSSGDNSGSGGGNSTTSVLA